MIKNPRYILFSQFFLHRLEKVVDSNIQCNLKKIRKFRKRFVRKIHVWTNKIIVMSQYPNTNRINITMKISPTINSK